MNILFLTYAYLPSLGGVQISVRNLAAELTRRGHHIVVATDGARPFTLERGVAPVLRLRIPYPLHRSWRQRVGARLLDGINVGALAAFCAARGIELAHCHLINVDTRYAIALKRILGIKVVITVRGGEFHHWIADRPTRRNYVRRMLESADAVTMLSHSQLDRARSLTSSLPLETMVIPNPADVDAIAHRADGGVPLSDASSGYILFAGRLEDEKRVELLIQAYHGLVIDDPSYPLDLVIMGGGSRAAALETAARAGAGAGRTRFLGARPYDDSLALIRGASILVLPSGRSEGCPNVVLEAMALGTPVVAADDGPMAELITHRVNGELFPSGDAVALEARLRRLTADPLARPRYVAAGREYLERRHRLDRIGDRYEELYRRVIQTST